MRMLTRANVAWLAVYLVYLAAIVGGMFWVRRTTLETMNTPEARRNGKPGASRSRIRTKTARSSAARRRRPSRRRCYWCATISR